MNDPLRQSPSASARCAHLAQSRLPGAADALNLGCHCLSVDRDALCAEIARLAADPEICRSLAQTHGNLFSGVASFVDAEQVVQMQRVIDAVESAVALPAYQEAVLGRSQDAARHPSAALGVFLGYDFHLDESGVQLIEINTNAGGAMLNALLRRAQRACCAELADVMAPEGPENDRPFAAVFLEEWRRVRGDARLDRIIIVDHDPGSQYLYPEFLMFRELFRRHGWRAEIADVGSLAFRDGRLWHDSQPVDLVYNRHTDFALERPESAALREAWFRDAAVVTPHPRAHALYADKRNLELLTDEARLAAMGIAPEVRSTLLTGIPRTVQVTAENAEAMWNSRREWFFKPEAGFGSRAAYRGDKLTRRVFGEIAAGGYVAQRTVMPSLRHTGETELKMDIRCYVYAGRIQLLAARLYSGQTTNFRTPGGGFAPVIVIGISGALDALGGVPENP